LVRQQKSRPLVDAIEPWLRAKLTLLSQKSKLAVAIRHALSRSDGPTRQRPTRTPQSNTGMREGPHRLRHIAVGHRTDTPRRTNSMQPTFGAFARRPCHRRSKTPLPATPLPPPDQILALSAAAKLVQTPSLIGAQVVRTTSLSHPNLQEAVAFVDGVALASGPRADVEIVYRGRTDRNLASRIFGGEGPGGSGWLWRNGIITARLEAPAAAAHRRS
jgi:hypothetical protein